MFVQLARPSKEAEVLSEVSTLRLGGKVSDKTSEFSGYAILELMGHNREIGFVTTEYFGGPALFRIEQPGLPEREYEITRAQWIGEVLAEPGTKVQRCAVPGKTVFVGPQAVFRMMPCDEDTCHAALESLISAPIKVLSLVERKRLDAAAAEDEDQQEEDVVF